MRQGSYIVFALLTVASSVAGSTPKPVTAGDPPGSSPAQTTAPWHRALVVAGVVVEGRPTETGFDAHRAQIHVCTDLTSLAEFVVDPSRFGEWVPFTRSARMLEKSEDSAVYYVRSTTPWPLNDTDMIYRIARSPAPDGLRLSLAGLPDYSPPNDGVARIRSAAGEWRLVPDDQGIDVSYELYMDPGSVPRFLANRRLAKAVGKTLANLSAHFSCVRRGVPP